MLRSTMISAALASAFFSAQATAATLSVSISGAESTKGQLIACLWNDRHGFPNCDKTKPLARKSVAVSAGETTVVFRDVAPGTYAVSVAHDANTNDKVDSNFLGIPREYVGMSNGAKGRLGAPKFKDAAIEIKGDRRIAVVLEKP